MTMRYSSLRRSFHMILCAVLSVALTVSLSVLPNPHAASRVPIARVASTRFRQYQ